MKQDVAFLKTTELTALMSGYIDAATCVTLQSHFWLRKALKSKKQIIESTTIAFFSAGRLGYRLKIKVYCCAGRLPHTWGIGLHVVVT